jgi:hypothetical protein
VAEQEAQSEEERMTPDRPTVTPIETHYGGCRFRSRLEARWAVFFDYLEIPWEFEPQGFQTSGGPYLPDFWLPTFDKWAEVKGSLTIANQRALYAAAQELPGTGILMLGDVPRVDVGWLCWHHWLAYESGPGWAGQGPGVHAPAGLFRYDQNCGWFDDQDGPPGVFITDPEAPNPSGWAFHAFVSDEPPIPEWGAQVRVANAYTAARSARFEHGQRG